MRILIAEDPGAATGSLEVALSQRGYDVVGCADGAQACRLLHGAAPPQLAVLAWRLPAMGCLEVCRTVRRRPASPPPYIILLLPRASREDIMAGLEAGADDYVLEPFDLEEVSARVRVGMHTVAQRSRAAGVGAPAEVVSRGEPPPALLGVCCYCQKVRDRPNRWQRVESAGGGPVAAEYSHGICPDCYAVFVRPQLAALKRQRRVASGVAA